MLRLDIYRQQDTQLAKSLIIKSELIMDEIKKAKKLWIINGQDFTVSDEKLVNNLFYSFGICKDVEKVNHSKDTLKELRSNYWVSQGRRTVNRVIRPHVSLVTSMYTSLCYITCCAFGFTAMDSTCLTFVNQAKN